jgi:hypothetical protein
MARVINRNQSEVAAARKPGLLDILFASAQPSRNAGEHLSDLLPKERSRGSTGNEEWSQNLGNQPRSIRIDVRVCRNCSEDNAQGTKDKNS